MKMNKVSLTVIGLAVVAMNTACSNAKFRSRSGVDISAQKKEANTCTIKQQTDGSKKIECPDGTSAIISDGKNGKDGTSCTVEETTAGAVIRCEDGTSANIKNGSSCTVKDTDLGADIECSDGVKVSLTDGLDGETGAVGQTGARGSDGASCSIVEESNGSGAMITCGSQSVLVRNGEDGQNGANGLNGKDAPTYAYQILEIINPCGAQGSHDEILLRFANGEVMAHYSDNTKQFLTLLKPGFAYATTDGTSCQFTFQADGTIVDKMGTRWSAK